MNQYQTTGTASTARTFTQTASGWVPSIPLPLYIMGRKQCQCGKRFWTMRGYQGHYSLVHILGYFGR